MFFTGFFKQIKQVVLHLHRMMQLPTQLASIGHTDRIHRAHAQLNLPCRKPGEPLIGERCGRIGIINHIAQYIPRLWTGKGKNPPLGGDVLQFNTAKVSLFVLNRLFQIILVIGTPCPS